MNGFEKTISKQNGKGLHSLNIETIQVNIGLKCNLECGTLSCGLLTKTEGNDGLGDDGVCDSCCGKDKCQAGRYYRRCARNAPTVSSVCENSPEKGFPVMVRTNLTILLQPGYDTFPDFFRDQSIQLCASLPCYLEENVDTQRGTGVLPKSKSITTPQ